VDLKLSNEIDSPTTAVLNARIRYKTDAGAIKAKVIMQTFTTFSNFCVQISGCRSTLHLTTLRR